MFNYQFSSKRPLRGASFGVFGSCPEFLCALFYFLFWASNPLLAQTTYQADLTSWGSVVLNDTNNNSSQPLHDQLLNQRYAEGVMMAKMDPLFLLTLSMTHTVTEQASLNKPEFNDWLNNASAHYESTILGAIPLIRNIDADGTIEKTYAGSRDIDLIRNFLRRFRIPQQAQESLRDSSIESRELMIAWLQGAQDEIRRQAESLKSAHAFLRTTGVVEAFLELSEISLYEIQETVGTLYDHGTLALNLQGVSSLLRDTSLGIQTINYRQSLMPRHALFHPSGSAPEPQGASNAAAFTFFSQDRNEWDCAIAGEPHQPPMLNESPIGPLFRFFPFCYYPRHNGIQVPTFGAHYMITMAGPALLYTRHAGNSGTANPIGGSFLFLVVTDLTQYLDENGVWHPFEVGSYEAVENGQAVLKPVYSVPEFGDVVALLEDTNTGIHYVMTQRRKTGSLTSDALLTKEKAAITNDSELYQEALFQKSTYHWGEAGCAPDENGRKKAYFVSHQGRADEVTDWTIDSYYFNFLRSGYRKTGTRRAVGCYGQEVVSSDNGSVRTGVREEDCPTVNNVPLLSMPKSWDAENFRTPRQDHVLEFAENNSLIRALTDDEVIQFGTSSYSASIQRWTEIVSAAALLYPDTIRADMAAVVNAFISLIVGYDGLNKGRAEELVIFRALPHWRALLSTYSVIIPPEISRYLLRQSNDAQAAFTALDELTSQLFNDVTVDALTFYLNTCLPNNIVTFKDANRMRFRGFEVMPGGTIAGPNPFGSDARISGLYSFITENNQQTCKIEFQSSSPYSHLYIDSQVYILPYGSFVSPDNLIGGDSLYNQTLTKWLEVRSQQNVSEGYGGLDSYRNICPLDQVYGAGEHPDTIQSFTIQIPALTRIPVPTPTPTPTSTLTPSPSPTPTQTSSPTPTPGDGPIEDCDNNNVEDSLQPDTDGDRTPDACDECPNDPSKTLQGVCGCGIMEQDLNANGVIDCNQLQESIVVIEQTLTQLNQIKTLLLSSKKSGGRGAALRSLRASLREVRGSLQNLSVEFTTEEQHQIQRIFRIHKQAFKALRSPASSGAKRPFRKLVQTLNRLDALLASKSEI